MSDTVKIRVNVTSGTPPYEYRVDGGEWQNNPFFTVPALDGAGGYLFEVRDAEGCIGEYPMYEEQIGLELIGGYVTPQLSVVASYGSNVPVQAQIDWGTGTGYPYDENDFEGTTEWTEDFDVINIIPFPISYAGSLHFFRARGRTRLGQILQNSIRGIYFVPGTIEFQTFFDTSVESEIIQLNDTQVKSSQISNRAQLNPDTYPQSFDWTISAAHIGELKNTGSQTINDLMKTNIQISIT